MTLYSGIDIMYHFKLLNHKTKKQYGSLMEAIGWSILEPSTYLMLQKFHMLCHYRPIFASGGFPKEDEGEADSTQSERMVASSVQLTAGNVVFCDLTGY